MKKIRFQALLLLSTVVLPLSAYCATLISAGQVTGATGSVVTVPIHFTPDAKRSTSSLQFDIALPSIADLVSIEAGPAATAAGKNTTSAAVKGKHRVILFGINQNAIADGEIALIRVKIGKGKAGDTLPVDVSNIVIADSNGKPITSKSKSGSVKITQ